MRFCEIVKYIDTCIVEQMLIYYFLKTDRTYNLLCTYNYLCNNVDSIHLISFLCCVFGRVCVAHLISFLCCVLFLFCLSLSCGCCVQCCQCLSIFSNVYSKHQARTPDFNLLLSLYTINITETSTRQNEIELDMFGE
jgi:hypothetical protein